MADPWLKRELNLADEDFAALLQRIDHCRTCGHFASNKCLLFSRTPQHRLAYYRHLIEGPCPRHTHAASDPYALCRDCRHLRPGNKCIMFAAGCDAEQRRRAVLATGQCRHRQTIEAPQIRHTPRTLDAYHFTTTAELIAASLELAADLDASQFVAVIAAARSGLIPAAAIATHYHLPLLAISPKRPSLSLIGSGHRLGDPGRLPDGKTLLIDDTACSGQTLADIRRTLARYLDPRTIATAAIYATPEAAATLDAAAFIYPKPHYLEWNFANSPYAKDTAFDIDGLLCNDPPCYDTDPDYQHHLTHAKPRYLPRKWPAVIISARCEAYRPQTETWLARNGVKTRELILWPGRADDRWQTPDTVANWKAETLKRLRRQWGIHHYAESDPRQAAVIADIAGIPVICPAARRVFDREMSS